MKYSLIPILFLSLICAALVAVGCSNTNSDDSTRSSYYAGQPGDYTTESGYGTDKGYTPEESDNIYGGSDPEYRNRSQYMGDEDMIPPSEGGDVDSPAGNYGD